MTGPMALQAVKARAQGCKGTSVAQPIKRPFQLSLQHFGRLSWHQPSPARRHFHLHSHQR